jgi:hypothetical protein
VTARGAEARLAPCARWALVLSALAAAAVGSATGVAFAAVLLAGSLVVSRFARAPLDAAVALFFLAHAAGTWVGYASIGAWGPLLHLLVPILVAMVLALGLADGRLRLPGRAVRRRRPGPSLLAATIGSLAIVVGWEVLERLMLLAPGVEIQTDRGDTIADLRLGALGTAIGVLASLVVLRRERGIHLGSRALDEPAP